MTPLRQFLAQAFDIRAGEGRKLLLLYLFAFLLNIAVVWGKSASEALFLDRFPASSLSYLFVADAILSIIAVIVYGSFIDRFSNKWVMVGICLTGAGLLVGMWVGITIQPETDVLYPALYLLERALRILISLHAWTYIPDFYDTLTAKRHFPIIASGSRTSGILAGALVQPIVTYGGGAVTLIIAWLFPLGLAAWLTWYIPRKVSLIQKDGSHAGSGNPIENMKQGVQLVNGSNFLRYLAIAAVASTMLITLLEFQSQVIFDSYFDTLTTQLGDADALNARAIYYGRLEMLANLIALPIQMLFLSRIVGRFGVGNANLIFPALTSLSYLFLFVAPTSLQLRSADFARIDTTALRSAFRTPIDSLLYNAVPSKIKGRVRAFINGLLVPCSSLIVGLLLIPAGTVDGVPTYIWVVGSLTAVTYLTISFIVRREYGLALAEMLAQDERAIFRMFEDGQETTPNPAALQWLRHRLDFEKDERTLMALSELYYQLEGEFSLPLLLKVAQQNNPFIRQEIIRLIGPHWIENEEVYALVWQGVIGEDEGVQETAVYALSHHPQVAEDNAVLSTFFELLHTDNREIQSYVIPTLIASGDFYYLAPAVNELARWLDARTEPHIRAMGLRVLARTGDSRLIRTLLHYLQDPEPMVRLQAVRLIDDLAAQTSRANVRQMGLQTLQGLLKDRDQRVRIAAVEGLSHFGDKSANEALLFAMQDEDFEVRRQACEVMPDLSKQQLWQALDSKDDNLAECAAILMLQQDTNTAQRYITEHIEQHLQHIYEQHAQRIPLQSEITTQEEIALLDLTLKEQADSLVRRVFWMLNTMLSFLLNRTYEEDVLAHALASQDGLIHANAIETIEAFTSPHVVSRLTPLFDGTPLEQLASMANIPAPSKEELFQKLWPALDGQSVAGDEWQTAVVIHTLTHQPIHNALSLTEQNTPTPLIQEAIQYAKIHNTSETSAMLTTIEKVIILKKVSFFQEMSINQLRIIASISDEAEHEAGSQIFAQGDRTAALHVVVDGEVAIQIERSRRGRKTGSITRLATIQPNEYFAEMSIFDNEPHSADAIALKNTKLLLVRQAPLVALIQHQPDLALNLLRVLSQRLRQTNEQVAAKSQSQSKGLVDLFDKLDQ